MQVFEGDGNIAADLMTRQFDHVFFTGGENIGKKVMEALNLENGKYFPSKKIDIKSDKVDLKSLISREDKFGEYYYLN